MDLKICLEEYAFVRRKSEQVLRTVPVSNTLSPRKEVMNGAEYGIRKEIIATCLAMERLGINQGTSGNVSARWADGLLITPSGLGL